MNKNTNKRDEFGPCTCGCGLNTMSTYLPGHDARHAGRVGKAAATVAVDGTIAVDDSALYTELPSAALRAKALRIAVSRVEKTLAKAAKAEAKQHRVTKKTKKAKAEKVLGTVKVGRWEYPAMQSKGKTWRKMNRDGSGEWNETEAPFTASDLD